MKAAVLCFIVIVAVLCASSCAHAHTSPSHSPLPGRPARHRRRAGGQVTPLQHQPHPLTIVSAYYPGPAKHSRSDYEQWGANFMRMRAPVVFFTDDTASMPAAAHTRPRDSVHIILKHPDDFYVSNLGIDWDAQLKIDQERHIHSVHLFRVWLEKTSFVMQAVRVNPFGSSYFAWVDYGYFRVSADPPWAPTPACLQPGRLLLLNTSTLHANPAKAIGGGAMAGDVEAWRAWNRTFYEALLARHAEGEFVGDDQTTMTQVVRAHPRLACVVRPRPGYGSGWFYLRAVLDGRRAGDEDSRQC